MEYLYTMNKLLLKKNDIFQFVIYFKIFIQKNFMMEIKPIPYDIYGDS